MHFQPWTSPLTSSLCQCTCGTTVFWCVPGVSKCETPWRISIQAWSEWSFSAGVCLAGKEGRTMENRAGLRASMGMVRVIKNRVKSSMLDDAED